MKLFIPLLSWLILFSSVTCFAFEIPHFARVTEKIARGGRPTQNDLRELFQNGATLIINIENNAEAITRETTWAKEIGIGYVSLPMDWRVSPTDQQIDKILTLLLAKSSNFNFIFIHCKHGQDRTGLVIGLYRVLIQKWAPQKAYDEMLTLGFHPEYTALTDYFWKRISASGPE